jgi:hypothetical protein
MTTGRTKAVAIAVAIAAALALGGCSSKTKAEAVGGSLPAATQATKNAASEVKGAAGTIAAATTRIEAAAPALKPDTDAIAAGVERLNVVAGSLETTGATLATATVQAKETEAKLAKAEAKIVALESEQSGLLNRLLTFGAVAGLGLAVVGGIWLRSWNAAAVGLGVFAACVAGQWLLAYRAAIAITAVSIAAITIAWKLVKERYAATQLVTTVEAAKATIADWDGFKSIANSVQGTYTRRVVDQVQKALGRKSKATNA